MTLIQIEDGILKLLRLLACTEMEAYDAIAVVRPVIGGPTTLFDTMEGL